MKKRWKIGVVYDTTKKSKGLFSGTVRMGVTVVGTKGSLSMRYDTERKLRIIRSLLPAEDETHFEDVELHEDRVLPAGAAPFDYEHYDLAPARYFADNNRFVALDLMQAITEDRQAISSVIDGVNAMPCRRQVSRWVFCAVSSYLL